MGLIGKLGGGTVGDQSKEPRMPDMYGVYKHVWDSTPTYTIGRRKGPGREDHPQLQDLMHERDLSVSKGITGGLMDAVRSLEQRYRTPTDTKHEVPFLQDWSTSMHMPAQRAIHRKRVYPGSKVPQKVTDHVSSTDIWAAQRHISRHRYADPCRS